MTQQQILTRLREIASEPLPLPGQGQTPARHRRLMQIGREDLSLARLAEAHFDAVAILDEAGVPAKRDTIYGVWASEKPGLSLSLDSIDDRLILDGTKAFCSGAGLIDRALVTVSTPEPLLLDIDLRSHPDAIAFDFSDWQTTAFQETNTAIAAFHALPIDRGQTVGSAGFYLDRPGFWHGACGPAACWAGGAARLFDYALAQKRTDPHTMAHLGDMYAAVWALQVYLDSAGQEIDLIPNDSLVARIRARTVRHLVEQASTDILRRLPRAYGPQPLAFNGKIARHYQELDLYLRQWHAERDLAALGEDCSRLFKPCRFDPQSSQ